MRGNGAVSLQPDHISRSSRSGERERMPRADCEMLTRPPGPVVPSAPRPSRDQLRASARHIRMIRCHVAAISAILALCVSGSALAEEAVRCGNRLALPGYSAYEVRSLCGEPDAVSRSFVQRAITAPAACWTRHYEWVCGSSTDFIVTVEVEDWTYDFGRNQFIRILRFENGRLLRVDTGGYGLKALP